MRKRLASIAPVLIASFHLLLTSPSYALNATWRAPETKDAWILGGFASTAALSEFVVPTAPFGPWQGDTSLDRWARAALKADGSNEQKRFSSYSDASVGAAVLLPYVVDVAGFAMGSRNNALAERIALINLQSLFANTTITSLTKGLVGRQRPDVSDCVRDYGREICLNREAYRSFISGHSSYAFMSAGLMCLHHTQLGLAGNAAVDGAICGGAMALAIATGTLRIIADRHHLTDVLAGIVVGLGTGYLLPALLFSTQSVSTSPLKSGSPAVTMPIFKLSL